MGTAWGCFGLCVGRELGSKEQDGLLLWTVGERRPKSWTARGDKQGGYCVHRERAACNGPVKGEGRGDEVQLTALMMCVCVLPRTGLLPAVCHARLGFLAAGQQPPTTSCVASGCWGASLLCPTAAALCQHSVLGGPSPRELCRPGLSTAQNAGFTVTKKVQLKIGSCLWVLCCCLLNFKGKWAERRGREPCKRATEYPCKELGLFSCVGVSTYCEWCRTVYGIKAQSVNLELIASWDLELRTDHKSSDSSGGNFATTGAWLDCF